MQVNDASVLGGKWDGREETNLSSLRCAHGWTKAHLEETLARVVGTHGEVAVRGHLAEIERGEPLQSVTRARGSSGVVAFGHHTEAEEWVRGNAVGPVVVYDSWTYGWMLFDSDGWQTVTRTLDLPGVSGVRS